MTDLPRLIGICGKKRHGKDSVATWLHSYRDFTVMALADELKVMALDIDPHVAVTADEHSGDWGSAIKLSALVQEIGMDRAKTEVADVRRFLQRLGTEGLRARDPGFWTRTLGARIDAAADVPVVVPDVRYDNEAEWILNRGGVVYRVVRAGYDNGGDSHASEAGVSDDLVESTIDNSGRLVDLHQRLDTLWGK